MAVSISIAITQNSQNIANNTSNVTATVTATWSYGSNNRTGECTGSITIDGTKHSFSGIKFNTGQSTSGSQTIMTKTVNVTHNNDGTKTLSCSASFYTGLSSSGTQTASASKTLTTIPRKSTLTVANGTLGTAQTLTITEQSSSFKHKLKYECGSASGWILGGSSTFSTDNSVSWTPPLSLASQNTTGTSVSVTFTLYTYTSGGDSVGSNTYTKTLSIPNTNDFKPSCSISVSESTSHGAYVKGLSKLRIVVTPTLSYGSAIDSYSVSANGATYTTATVTTGALSTAGTMTITATVKDKRGRTGSASTTITVVDKSTLTVANGTLGTAQTLTITEQSSSFKHKIEYVCGSMKGYVLGSSSTFSTDNSVSWTPPFNLATQNTKGTSLSVTYTLHTYTSGGTLVGSNSYTKTLSIPDVAGLKPTVSISVSDEMSYSPTYGGYIQGLSKLKIEVTVAGMHGATVSSKTEVDGKTYTATSFTTGVVGGTGTLTIKSTVTDSRGRTNTASQNISVLPYEFPKITALKVYRAGDLTGKASPAGSYLAVKFSSEITALNNKNTAAYTIQYKKMSATQPTTQTLTDYAGKYSVSNGLFVFSADLASSYDITLTVKDGFRSVSKPAIGSSVKKVWSMLKKSNEIVGIAINKLAETEGVFDVDMVVRARKGIIVDCDWVNLDVADDYTLYNGTVANQPKYKATGNVVTVTGALSPRKEYTSNYESVVIASGIPANLRPATNQVFVCQGSGMNRWTCQIKTNGTVTMERYGITDVTTVPTTAWLAFSCTYQI